MGTRAISQTVHECSCQSTEGSWAQVLVDRDIIGTGVSPQRVRGHVSVHRGFMGTGVRRQRYNLYSCQSTQVISS